MSYLLKQTRHSVFHKSGSKNPGEPTTSSMQQSGRSKMMAHQQRLLHWLFKYIAYHDPKLTDLLKQAGSPQIRHQDIVNQ